MNNQKHYNEIMEEVQQLRQLVDEQKKIISINTGEMEKLKAVENWYDAIFENTGTGALLLDKDTTVIRANMRFLNNYGYAKDEVEGKSWTNFVDKADVERMKEYHRMRREDPDSAPKSYIFKLNIRNEQTRYANLNIDMIPGTMISIASLLDITDLISSEKALEESERKYRLLVENMNDGLIVMDRTDMISYANERASKIMGYPLNEIVGHPMINFIDDNSSQIFNEEIRKRNLGLQDQYEITFRGKDGSKKHTIMSPRVIMDDNGNFSGSFGIITDITERKKAEDALRSSEEMFSKAFRSSPFAVTITTLEEGIFIDANESFMRMTGYGRNEVIGASVHELNFWPDSVYRDQLMLRLRNNGSIRNMDVRFRKRSGDIHYGIYSAEMIEVGGTKCVLSVLLDVTEQKRLEEEILRISENERRKIGQDLHDDLQQHLIGMEALASSLVNKLAQKKHAELPLAREIFDLTVTAIEKTRRMARGLCPVYLDESAIMTAVSDFAGFIRKTHGISCIFVPDGVISIKDNTTALNLFYIIQEAVNNAVKHGKAREIIISLSALDEKLVLKVVDNGPGLKQDMEGGSGLGLNIMRYRAKMIGGKLTLFNNPDRGVTVQCVLK